MTERTLTTIHVDLIFPNPQQPRRTFDEKALDELATSIREHGVIQPIEVEAADGGRYMLHHGERRWRASKRAGLQQVPAIVVAAQDERTRMARALVENIQREDMNPIELALAFAEMRRQGMALMEISRHTGKAHATIANHLAWLEMEAPIQDLVARGWLARDGRVREALQSVPADVRLEFARRCRNMTIKGVVKAAQVLRDSLATHGAKKPSSNGTAIYDCRNRKSTDGRRAHCLTLVVNDCPVPGPTGEVIEHAAQATCEACNLFEYKAGISCKECPATTMVRGLVRAAEKEALPA